MNILRPLPFRHFILSILLLTTLIFSTWLFSHLIGFEPYLIIGKVKGSFFLLGLRAILRLLGLEIPIFLLLALLALVGCGLHMNDPAGGGQPAAEQASNLPASPGWTSIFGSDSGENSVGSSEASVNQAPVIPELHPPLLDDNARRAELTSRFYTNILGVDYRERVVDSVLEAQVRIEKHIEAALVADGYSPYSILAKRNQIRGFAFYPYGKALSESTYALHLKQILNSGTRQSIPYHRIERAINDLNLLI